GTYELTKHRVLQYTTRSSASCIDRTSVTKLFLDKTANNVLGRKVKSYSGLCQFIRDDIEQYFILIK
ncbi:hypothetical protein SK128_010122, partial [Halocaridina rubra]